MALDRVGPLLQEILCCVDDGLTCPVARAFVAPGANIAWDDCCSGQAWVRVISIEAQPGATQAQPCGVAQWRITLGLGVIRCAATVDAQGNAPADEELTSDGLAMTRDMTDILEVIKCCIPEIKPIQRYEVLNWVPEGPEGGCHGGEWSIVVVINNCACETSE